MGLCNCAVVSVLMVRVMDVQMLMKNRRVRVKMAVLLVDQSHHS
jgi:hypothetical protein